MEPVVVPETKTVGSSPAALSSPESDRVEAERLSDKRSTRQVQVFSWVLLALFGLIQAWSERHRLFSDGLSYLEIASYYAKGDWHSALNSYWSPLYSWIIAVLMLVLRPNPYWHVGLLHIVNFCAYLASLAGLEAILGDLFRFRERHIGPLGLSEVTIRVVAYCTFLIACLSLINLGYNSPDLLAMALQFYLLHLLLQIEEGRTRDTTWIKFGAALGLEYLCRAAFAPFVVLYIVIAGFLLFRRRLSLGRPLALTVLVTLLLSAPFVTALSISKGRFTMGDAGPLNYGWEIDGASRWTHWQGEPGDIGRPLHPTHKVLDNPPTYTFASPVPGTYPPWYEPSYWYQGIKPHLKLQAQIKVFTQSLKGVFYLFVRSPITIPVLILALAMGWRRWLSNRGILAFWLLLIPTSTYILAYTLVYLDPRYIASSLLVIWLCMLASVSVANASIRGKANRILQELSILFAVVFLASRLEAPARVAASDLIHLHETDWNLNWMLKEQLVKMGLQPTDRVAWIGQAIDAEWARLAHVKIVAEVPVTYVRDNTLFRRIDYGTRKQLKVFWDLPPDQKEKVFQAFRDAGATVVVAEKLPYGVDQTGWRRILDPNTPHLTDGIGQSTFFRKLCFKRISPAPSITH